jgi:hypothetical protein
MGCGTYQTFENLYFHGWKTSLTSGTASRAFSGGCGEPSTGTTVRYSVSDGSDTAQNMMTFSYPALPIAYGNVMRYMVSGLDGCGDNWHDNLFENMVSQVGGGHQDAFLQNDPCGTYNSGQYYFFYNNIVRHTLFASSGGSGHVWLQGLGDCGAIGTPLTNCIGYAFNNVVYDNIPGNMVDVGSHYGVNLGTLYFFNNTVQCGTDTSAGSCEIGDNGNAQGGVAAGGTMAVNLINNHWIVASVTTSVLCCSEPAGAGNRGSCYSFTCSDTTPSYQTVTTANAQGYTDTGNFAFQPTSGSGSTVGAGTNESSLCQSISGINSDAGSACMNATSYACTYNATNHTVSCPANTAIARPTSGGWDIGAYQFSSTTQASVPGPPKGLTATVQ